MYSVCSLVGENVMLPEKVFVSIASALALYSFFAGVQGCIKGFRNNDHDEPRQKKEFLYLITTPLTLQAF